MKRKIKLLFFVLLILAFSALTVIYSADLSKYISSSVNNCLTVIVPSLYIFMIISGFLTSTNLYKALSRPFDLISRYIFKIPTEYFSIFLISSVGGYPVGAKLITDLKLSGRIDNHTAETMLCYCYLGGPAFFCGVVGINLFNNTFAGIIVFLSILLTNIISGIIIGIGRTTPQKLKICNDYDISYDKLINSIISGAKSLFMICAIIVFFSSVICFADKLMITDFIAERLSYIAKVSKSSILPILATFIEISHISDFQNNCYQNIPIITALMSFGGLCIIMQIKCIVGNKVSMKYFLAGRIFSFVLSYYISRIMVRLFSDRLFIEISTTFKIGHRQISPIPTIFLAIMTILLLSKNCMEKN